MFETTKQTRTSIQIVHSLDASPLRGGAPPEKAAGVVWMPKSKSPQPLSPDRFIPKSAATMKPLKSRNRRNSE